VTVDVKTRYVVLIYSLFIKANDSGWQSLYFLLVLKPFELLRVLRGHKGLTQPK